MFFSDKTGTLTENEMIFRRCTIGGVDYNHNQPEHAANSKIPRINAPNETPVLNPILLERISRMDTQIGDVQLPTDSHFTQECQRIQDFFLLMAVCNTVVVSKHPHVDKMNSSGLFLDSSSNSMASLSDSMPSESQDRYMRLINSDTPTSSAASTPTNRPQHLPIPIFGGSRAATPSPTPSPREIRPFYEAESPDEIALVEAVFRYDCKLLRRTLDSVQLLLPGNGVVEYRVLHVLPFDAVRKRMSVILLHPYTSQRILLCKGADSTIFTQLAPTQDQETQHLISKTQQNVNKYSRLGLRILCMAKRTISPDVYEVWAREHREIELSLENREEKLYESACKIERHLELLGCTGIEDRLQEGVPETIANLRKAGIVVWVLTGDKQETAVNIAYSCRLFAVDMEIITLNARSKEAAENTLRFYLDQVEKDLTTETESGSVSYPFFNRFFFGANEGLFRNKSQRRSRRALVVDGRTLTFVLDKSVEKLFLKLTMSCASVLCCRATPLQKASVVKLVKDKLKVLTLAIGDGANDVSMIQTADVGIGISGEEGRQAVMASDFVLARFSHLERLLLVHGHWCYDRLARTILYFFYKNACFIFIIFWYQIFNGFSGMVMMDQLYLMLFNALFTAVPPLIFGIYDRDAPDYVLQSEPTLYAQGRKSEIYRKYSFWVNMLDALYQSIIVYFVPHLVYNDTDAGIWEFGTTIHTACVIVQLMHIAIETRSWTVLHLLGIVFSMGVYFGFAVVYNLLAMADPNLQNPYYVIQHCMNTANFWLIQLLVCVLACLPRLVVRALQNSLMPSEVTLGVIQNKLNSKSKNRPIISVAWSRDDSIVFRNRFSVDEETFPEVRIPTISASCSQWL